MNRQEADSARRPRRLRRALTVSSSALAQAVSQAAAEVDADDEIAQLATAIGDRFPTFLNELNAQLDDLLDQNREVPGARAAIRHTRLAALREAAAEIRKLDA